ncbi:MAG: site-2 protease family protein [Oscillospiraceae bacterium]|nr:site-2 protease family protein [Oscillospiraceae bacterium]
MLGFNLSDILINVPITLVALTGHELAHAYVSAKLGDPTPRMHGRLTVNPLAHLDLVGTLLMIFTGFGWAKPVMVDPRYYKNRKQGMALTAIAGPVANLIMAFLALLIYALIYVICVKLNFQASKVVNIAGMIFGAFAIRNLCFMVFNIIPIPPLDGSKVLGMFLPDKTYYTMLQYERYSMILIMVLSLTGAFSRIIGVGVNAFMNGIMSLLMVGINLIL